MVSEIYGGTNVIERKKLIDCWKKVAGREGRKNGELIYEKRAPKTRLCGGTPNLLKIIPKSSITRSPLPTLFNPQLHF